jgi:hypothetical protein
LIENVEGRKFEQKIEQNLNKKIDWFKKIKKAKKMFKSLVFVSVNNNRLEN